jgi:IS30 family transposase
VCVTTSVVVRRRVMDLLREGLSGMQVAELTGVAKSTVYDLRAEVGGVIPRASVDSGRFLSRDERYEIARLAEAGLSMRAIAGLLARAPSTVSRELGRNRDPRTGRYQPESAQSLAHRRRLRPRPRRLQACPRLRRQVQTWLEERYSPEQIAGRLMVDFPEDPAMRISHESIYQAVYVRGGGQLKRELRAHLRTQRTARQPQASRTRRRDGRGRIPGAVSIHERPEEVAGRLVPGHHEGDLIMGAAQSNSAIGTVVERTTGFLTLLHLPDGHGAAAVADAVARALPLLLPASMRKTLTWDNGREMSQHARITRDIGIDVYFADPYSPWQRGSNENINGLLREYFPKGTDLSVHTAADLAAVARQLNDRPPKRLGFHTPAEVMHKLITDEQQQTVATIT